MSSQVMHGIKALDMDLVVQSSGSVDVDYCTLVKAKDVCLSEGTCLACVRTCCRTCVPPVCDCACACALVA